ncbi:hypothetical protein, partial [Hominenteromicrobium sp.]|uniref:hypothetical protein n=1 Tax=Hominenteromicrobium sp. TaxID=3073581 RepID=UPI003AEFC3A5
SNLNKKIHVFSAFCTAYYLSRRATVTAVPEITIPKAAPAARLPPKQSPLRPHNVERDHEIRYRYT